MSSLEKFLIRSSDHFLIRYFCDLFVCFWCSVVPAICEVDHEVGCSCVSCCCCCSVTKSHLTPLCDPTDCGTPGFPVLHYLPEFAQTHVHWAGDCIKPSHPVPYSSLFAFSFSQHQGLFGSGSALCIRWPKYWHLNFSFSLFNEYSVLISFRIDWFDLLSVQETLKNLFKHYSSKASILWCSALFTAQLSYPCMILEKP